MRRYYIVTLFRNELTLPPDSSTVLNIVNIAYYLCNDSWECHEIEYDTKDHGNALSRFVRSSLPSHSHHSVRIPSFIAR